MKKIIKFELKFCFSGRYRFAASFSAAAVLRTEFLVIFPRAATNKNFSTRLFVSQCRSSVKNFCWLKSKNCYFFNMKNK